MKQVADDQQRIGFEYGVPRRVAGSVEGSDAGQHLFPEPELLYPAGVALQHFPGQFSARSGGALPVLPFRRGNIYNSVGEGGLSVSAEQSADVVAVHVGQQDAVDFFRGNAVLFKFAEHRAPLPAVAGVDQDQLAAALQHKDVDGGGSPLRTGQPAELGSRDSREEFGPHCRGGILNGSHFKTSEPELAVRRFSGDYGGNHRDSGQQPFCHKISS